MSTIHLPKLLYQRDGKLTEELRLDGGGFGLGKVPARFKPTSTTNMVCGYCSTGCSLKVHLRDGQAVGLTPDEDYSVNQGTACPKGWEALSVLDADDRGTQPMVRSAKGSLEPCSWDQAMETFVARFKGIQAEHGDDAVAFLSTGQIPTEEMLFLGSLAKFGMGMKHGDGNTRQCMATAVTAYKQSFGFDAPPYCYEDYEASDTLVFVGANPCISHPIMWQRVLNNPNDPRIIVIDPRKTETGHAGTSHLALRPKSDLILFYALANLLIERDEIDHEYIENHTNEFEAFAEHVKPYTLEYAIEHTGLSEREIRQTGYQIAHGKRVSFWWTMGVNQSYEGVLVAQAIINLALMTGNIGKPGTGANSITGQCNAMGSRLFSNTTNLLGGYQFENAAHREHVADCLGIDVERIPDETGMAYDQILEAVETGQIRGLWIIATNTAHTWINRPRAKRILEKLDFLVVQDMYHTTQTVEYADLYLPAAGWGEKEGTFINSERRIGLIKNVSKAPGEALADFHILKLIAHYWGCGDMFSAWNNPEDVFEVMKQLSAGQPCDFSGIVDYEMLDAFGGIQWPAPAASSLEPFEERRMFEDGQYFHEDARARFCFGEPQGMPESPDDEYPVLLLTGRGTAAQWHTQTRTGKSKILQKLYPREIYFEMNPLDAAKLGIEPEGLAKISSRRGELTAKVHLTNAVQPGQIFIPMHYAKINELTLWSVDPQSRQPNYKACAVRVSPVTDDNKHGGTPHGK